ncbi:addiction module protein [Ectopseudomonas oleovorans]|uniref:Addiction module component n=1 Tax=Ectopseudomonas oleovorans (strain CECT 5344) TaxID=1182590 RepID=W6RH27_ECTO5|nr:addiction module protein [Pseudomonas oleovorans]CDM41219.1 hypothetical protein BN5_2654 [Pseudomonas oleovorans CECT 5344]CDR91847.1 hypothetical protein PPSAL_2620 [Pseudomonas oleovorans]
MNLQKIEAEVLHLSRQERAVLIQKLVLSLDNPSPEELREDWLSESQLRAAELDSGKVRGIPGDEVLRKARSLLE